MKRFISRAAALILALAVIVLTYPASAGYGGSAAYDTGASDRAYELTARYFLSKLPDGASCADWVADALDAGGYKVPDNYFKDYLAAVSARVKAADGILSARKYTEYSVAVIGVTAAGGDASRVAGYDLTSPLGDFDAVTRQGLNGPVFALIALDRGGYKSDMRTEYVDYILSRELPDGGWAFSGNDPDPDMTAMALRSLAPYLDSEDVSDAADRALARLSALQLPNGGYRSFGKENSESSAQVVIALAALGIAPDDARFVKNGSSALDALLAYAGSDGSFRHTPDGDADMIATTQAFAALGAVRSAFSGDCPITRGGAAKALLGLGGFEKLAGNTFADKPGARVTREMLASALYRLAAISGRGTSARFAGKFSDAAEISAWASDAVSWCAAEGIFVGSTDGRFLPKQFVTRGQLDAVLGRYEK